jgi:Kef-type K+ transport system membrane component KefB
LGAHFELAIRVFAALFVVLAATTLCGRLAQLVGQPKVVGEMVAGVLLGPSLLGAVAPGATALLFPTDVKSTLYVLAMIGLTFYMFLVGASLDHGHTNGRSVRRSATLAMSGIVTPLVLGGAVAALFFGTLAADGVSMVQFMLFLGGALSITAFPMLARILQERGIANTRIGSLTLVAAAIDDAAAWALLALIVASATAGGGLDAAITIGGGALFALVMLTVGKRLLRLLAKKVERDGGLRHESVAIVLLVVIAAGWFTDYIGIFSVFGGFITGLAMPQSTLLRQELQTRLSDLNTILLLPVFFAFSGLNTELGGLLSWEILLPTAVIMLAAVVGKYGGCGLAARLQGESWRHASAIGGLMNARGLMILIFINIGLAYGLITTQVFSILVVVAVVTTAAAMPIYRRSMPAWLEEAELRNSATPAAPVRQAEPVSS